MKVKVKKHKRLPKREKEEIRAAARVLQSVCRKNPVCRFCPIYELCQSEPYAWGRENRK